jgi:hypothetical protein
MIFELISWIYISLICLIWGNLILKIFFGINKGEGIDFPIVCFIGMAILGVIAFYISLFIPLFFGVKLALQIPVLLYLTYKRNREQIFSQVRNGFAYFSLSDSCFLVVALLMILFICTAPVIHPDTLNYHVFSVQIFDKYGAIPGIGNVKMHLGFQSLWFALLSLFSISLFHFGPIYPLNGIVMVWVIIFLVSKAGRRENILSGIWYLILVLFCILSWTQIRLTASSLSPDFIATISVFLSFYYFICKREIVLKERFDSLVVLFSIISVTIKLSAAPVLLLPMFVIGGAVFRGKWLFAGRIIVCMILLSIPVLVRNIISTGYPFYPSLFASIYAFDWKVDPSRVITLQHYITSYARYPVLISEIGQANNESFHYWFPAWWKHLYVIDKIVMLVIAFGTLVDILFFRIWKRFSSSRKTSALFVAATGVLFWFVEAPDPRFGTGFLLTLIYLQYAPIISKLKGLEGRRLFLLVDGIKYLSTLCIIVYIGYRAVYFFRPRQIVFPEGINYANLIQPDCDGQIKQMILKGAEYIPQLPDSCRHFIFRGSDIRQGFKSAP